MRRAGQCPGVQRDQEVDAHGLELHLAEARDGGGKFAAEDVERHGVAELQAQFAALLLGKAHQRGSVVVRGPPGALGEDGALGRGDGIGDAAVAAQGPVLAHHLARGAVVDAGDDAAQHRRGADVGDAGLGFAAVEEARELVVLDVDEEIGRRAFGQFGRDQIAQVRIDLADRGEHGQAEAEREHDRGGLAARAADRAEGEAEGRAAPGQAAGGGAAGQRPGATRGEEEQEERDEHARGGVERQFRRAGEQRGERDQRGGEPGGQRDIGRAG